MADEIKQVIKIEASLTQIQGQLKTLEGNFKSSFGSISSVASSALGGLGIGLGVGAIVAFGKGVVNLAGQLKDLSEQTGISGQTLSGLKSTLEENGTSLEAFAKGIFTAQKELGGIKNQSDPAAQAVKRLGLNLDELRNASTDQFLKLVTDALAKTKNQMEFNTLGAALLGRAFRELGPAIREMAGRLDELRKQGMSDENIRALDEFGDSLTRLTNILQVLAATPLANLTNNLRGIAQVMGLMATTAAQDFHELEGSVKSFTETVARSLGMETGRVLQMTKEQLEAIAKSGSTLGDKLAIGGLLTARSRLQEFLNKNSIGSGPEPKPAREPFRPPADDSKIKKLESALQSYRESLIKTITTQEVETIKLTLGEEAALKAAQAYQVLGLRASLAADGLKIPAEVQDSAREAEKTLKSLGANVQILGEKNFAKLQGGALSSAAALDALKDSLKDTTGAVQAFADAANEGVGIQFFKKEDVARDFEKLKDLRQQIDDLRKTLAIELLPEDQQGNARIIQEVEDRIKVINDWRDAAIAAGKDVAQANDEAAQLSAEAWAAAGAKMKETIDETTEFTRRAFERGFDAASDTLKDFLDNGVTNFADFSEKIRKMINSLVADFLILQAKEALFGKDFGKKGAEIGGLIGKLFGKAEPRSIEDTKIAGAAADTLDAERGKELATAASALTETAVTTTASTAQVAIQTLGSTTLATTQAAIGAVEAVAIAAINAAAAAAGVGGNAGGAAGLFGGLFGGGDAGAASAGGGLVEGGFYHKGGVVGVSPMTRTVDPRVFTGAPRYHAGNIMGLRTDERPAILQTGERVLPRGWRTGGGDTYNNVTMNKPLLANRESIGQVRAQFVREMQRGRRNT